jgi:hypothetical protein
MPIPDTGREPFVGVVRAFAAGGALGAEMAFGYFLARQFGGGPLVSALMGVATLGVAWETARRWERGRRRWGSGRR